MNSIMFARVFESPKTSSDRYLTILARPNETDHPRLGLAVSKKSARRAVQRNIIKRVIRESFRNRKYQLIPVDLVVLSKKAAGEASKKQLAASIDRLWSRFCDR